MKPTITLTDANYGNPIRLLAEQVIATTIVAETTYRESVIPDGVFRRTLVYLASSNQLAVRETPDEVWALVEFLAGAPREERQPARLDAEPSEEIRLAMNRDAARYRILRDANTHGSKRRLELFESGESEFESFLKQGKALDEALDEVIERHLIDAARGVSLPSEQEKA